MSQLDWHAERSTLLLLDSAPESEGIDLKAVRRYRQERLRQQMERYGMDVLILSDPVNIRFETGCRNMQVFSMRNAPSRCKWNYDLEVFTVNNITPDTTSAIPVAW